MELAMGDMNYEALRSRRSIIWWELYGGTSADGLVCAMGTADVLAALFKHIAPGQQPGLAGVCDAARLLFPDHALPGTALSWWGFYSPDNVLSAAGCCRLSGVHAAKRLYSIENDVASPLFFGLTFWLFSSDGCGLKARPPAWAPAWGWPSRLRFLFPK